MSKARLGHDALKAGLYTFVIPTKVGTQTHLNLLDVGSEAR